MPKVGPKGQVVISKEIREELGIVPGSVAIQRVVDGKVEITFLRPKHRRSLYGVLAPYTTVNLPDEDAMRDAVESAQGIAAAERWNETLKPDTDRRGEPRRVAEDAGQFAARTDDE
jgi:AbrB family looped-hinge helix DNA binding protein